MKDIDQLKEENKIQQDRKVTHFTIKQLMLVHHHVGYTGWVGVFVLGIKDSKDVSEVIYHQICTVILGLLNLGFSNLATFQGYCGYELFLVFLLLKIAPYPTSFGPFGRS